MVSYVRISNGLREMKNLNILIVCQSLVLKFENSIYIGNVNFTSVEYSGKRWQWWQVEFQLQQFLRDQSWKVILSCFDWFQFSVFLMAGYPYLGWRFQSLAFLVRGHNCFVLLPLMGSQSCLCCQVANPWACFSEKVINLR